MMIPSLPPLPPGVCTQYRPSRLRQQARPRRCLLIHLASLAAACTQLDSWLSSKPRILVMNRKDLISKKDQRLWHKHFQDQAVTAYWTDGKAGIGVRVCRRTWETRSSGAAGERHRSAMGGAATEPTNPGAINTGDLPLLLLLLPPQAVKRAAVQVSVSINEKRARRGLQPRPVRACVIGFPNIGKSALINRLLDRRASTRGGAACGRTAPRGTARMPLAQQSVKVYARPTRASAPRRRPPQVVESYNKPGVTRVLRWVRLDEDIDLLDAPGIIPASFSDQVGGACDERRRRGDAGWRVEGRVGSSGMGRCLHGPDHAGATRDS